MPDMQALMIPGGGGLVIQANNITSQSFCTITNSIFTNNSASSGQYWFLSPSTNPIEYFGLGRGGGISIVFRGGSANTTVLIDSVRIEGNMAQYGGGLYLAFSETSGNNVTIVDTVVTDNRALVVKGIIISDGYGPSKSNLSKGGGVFLHFITTNTKLPFNITVVIKTSIFIFNTADDGVGGGFAIDVFSIIQSAIASNRLLIENCLFNNSTAIMGSSIHISQTGNSQQPLLSTTLCCSNFTTNGGYIGNVRIESMLVILKGTLMFTENQAPALNLRFSSIVLLPSTHVYFFGNQVALFICDCSSVVVNNGVSLLFVNNTADDGFGVITATSCSLDQPGNRYCFIRHSNSSLHPNNWGINVIFIGNEENTINVESAQSCTWPNTDKNTTFCWEGWSYWSTAGVRQPCHSRLMSGPAYISHTGPTKYTVYPGECISGFTVYDDWDNDITDSSKFRADLLLGPKVNIEANTDCVCRHLPIESDQCLAEAITEQCQSNEIPIKPSNFNDYVNHTSRIFVYLDNIPGVIVDIEFKTCDNGSLYQTVEISGKSYNQCICEQLIYSRVCPRKMEGSQCITYCESSCFIPSFYDNSTIRFFKDQSCISCADPDYGVAINFPRYICAPYEPYGVAIYIFLQLVPVLIMMIVLAVLHINITNGNLNGYILYSQMVTLQFPELGYTGWVPTVGKQFEYFFFMNHYVTIPLVVYSIWNLNFLTLYPVPFSIPNVPTAVDVILLQYVTAACPLLFIAVSYTWIHCYNNGYGLVVHTTRPCHRILARFWRKLNIQPSLIDTYAGLILLSYMRFLAVSVKLLQLIANDLYHTPLAITSEEVVQHTMLGILAILCLLVFVTLPMMVLLLYPFKIFQQCLTCCRLNKPGLHALVDACQGCFKNSATDGVERRYFAGIYLFFRFCYLAIFMTPIRITSLQEDFPNSQLVIAEAGLSFIMTGLVVILRPYKSTAHNVIDFLMFFFMMLIALFILLPSLSINTSQDPSIILMKGPLYLPFFLLYAYIIYRVIKSCFCFCVIRCKNVHHHFFPDNDETPSEQQPLLSSPQHTATEVALDNCVSDYPEVHHVRSRDQQSNHYQVLNELERNAEEN